MTIWRELRSAKESEVEQLPDDLQPRIGLRVQQELADESLLAEVVREVLLTLRSRGVSHPQATIEAYHTARNLVRQQLPDRSVLAQMTTSFHIFCLATSPVAGRTAFPPPISDLPEEPHDISGSEEAKVSLSVHRRSKRVKNRRNAENGEQGNTMSDIRKNELHTMPYQEYLQTPEWQAQRQLKLQQADYRCQVCNKNIRLEVHHRTYERRGFEKEQDLTVLCEECHSLFHERMLQNTETEGT
jgi:5-methylcytosine-specific restriction endonuclease McrA